MKNSEKAFPLKSKRKRRKRKVIEFSGIGRLLISTESIEKGFTEIKAIQVFSLKARLGKFLIPIECLARAV